MGNCVRETFYVSLMKSLCDLTLRLHDAENINMLGLSVYIYRKVTVTDFFGEVWFSDSLMLEGIRAHLPEQQVESIRSDCWIQIENCQWE